jgi:hypothetical protein
MHGDIELLSVVQSTRNEGLSSCDLGGSSRGEVDHDGGRQCKIEKGMHCGLIVLQCEYAKLMSTCKGFQSAEE